MNGIENNYHTILRYKVLLVRSGKEFIATLSACSVSKEVCTIVDDDDDS